MGSWGKASLESDAGLDVLDALIEYVMDRKSVQLNAPSHLQHKGTSRSR